MPITLTYDLKRLNTANSNAHAYVRNAFERFNWEKKGRSTFVYNRPAEDWLNDVIPALMFFRSFVEQNKMPIEAFTLHVHSLSAEENPKIRASLRKVPGQASDAKLRSFLAECTKAAPLV